MNTKRLFQCGIAGFSLLCLVGCATQYETDTLTNFVDRETLEDVAADEITSQSVDIQQMQNEKKLYVGIRLNVQDESQGRASVAEQYVSPEEQDRQRRQFEENARILAANYLTRVNAYRVVVLPRWASKSDLMSGKDFDAVKYHFLIDMHVVTSSELEQRSYTDEAMYKTSIAWTLIDNRTKSNGLGSNDVPFAKEALTCKNVTSRKLAIRGVSGRRMAGADARNAQNAFKNTLENALIEFRAQLANRIPFGGKIFSFRERDGKIRMTLKAGADDGITARMQMLIINEEGDQVAIATATGGAKSTESTLQVWRWLSPSLKKQIEAIASNKKKVEEFLDEKGNGLYAICLGMPTPSKDERTQIQDFK